MSMGTLAGVARDIAGQLQGPDASFESVSTDTRTIGPGQLFFALRGERYDAQKFVADAANKGAAGAVVEQFAEVDLSQVAVGDSRLALGSLARKWRQHFDIPVIGITGSNGKTTVKELTASIMRVALSEYGDDVVLATTGNLNNDIGLPLTLLGLRDFHQSAVIEMGANHPGEIAVLADIAAVNIAVITNAARAHLEGFGSIEDVAQTKGELLDALAGKDVAILNRDDSFFSDWVARIGSAQLCTFGLSADADIRAEQVQLVLHDAQPAFELIMCRPGWPPVVMCRVGCGHSRFQQALLFMTIVITRTLIQCRLLFLFWKSYPVSPGLYLVIWVNWVLILQLCIGAWVSWPGMRVYVLYFV